MRISAKILKLFLVVSFTLSGSSLACEFHDGYGFGGHLQGRYNNWNSYSPESTGKALVEQPKSWLHLTTQSMISAEMNEKSEIKIEYQLLQNLSDVNFSLEASPDVKVIDFIQIKNSPESGHYIFTIIPTKTGIIKLVIIASENTNEVDEVKTLRKIVYLNSSHNPV